MIKWIESKRGNIEFALWVMFIIGMIFGIVIIIVGDYILVTR